LKKKKESVAFLHISKPYMKILWILAMIAIVLLACRYSRGRWVNKSVDRPKMRVTNTYGNIEQRTTPSMIMASVDVSQDMNKAMNSGFQILAWYIFGGNTSKSSIERTAPVTSKKSEKIAMTAPVITTNKKNSEKIAMTAPVTSNQGEDGTTVSFVMPDKYTLDSLPIPDDTRISFKKTEPLDIYVWSFDGYTTNWRAEKQLEKFKTELEKYNLLHTWSFTLAQYNDPRTPTNMRLNEWRIETK